MIVGWVIRGRGECDSRQISHSQANLSQAAHSREVMLVCGSASASLITPDMSSPPLVMLLSLRLIAQVERPGHGKKQAEGDYSKQKGI